MKTNTDDQRKTAGAVIRRARRNDASGVGELLTALGYPSPVARIEERIADCENSADTAVMVAELVGQVAGVVSFHRIPLFHTDGFLGRITSLVVAPGLRQRGVGRVLVAAVEEFAWAHGCIRVEVTSGDHRADAHGFYENLGYRLDCRRFVKHDPNG